MISDYMSIKKIQKPNILHHSSVNVLAAYLETHTVAELYHELWVWIARYSQSHRQAAFCRFFFFAKIV